MSASSLSQLTPIDRPQSWFVRLAYRISARDFGKVPAVMKVLYARRPMFIGPSRQIANTLGKTSLSVELRMLMGAYTSMLNGCGYCRDLAEAKAVQQGIGMAKFNALAAGPEADAFTEPERAVLRYLDALAARSGARERAEALFEHFSEQEVLDIVWTAAAHTYFNFLAAPLGIAPDGLRALAENARQKSS